MQGRCWSSPEAVRPRGARNTSGVDQLPTTCRQLPCRGLFHRTLECFHHPSVGHRASRPRPPKPLRSTPRRMHGPPAVVPTHPRRCPVCDDCHAGACRQEEGQGQEAKAGHSAAGGRRQCGPRFAGSRRTAQGTPRRRPPRSEGRPEEGTAGRPTRCPGRSAEGSQGRTGSPGSRRQATAGTGSTSTRRQAAAGSGSQGRSQAGSTGWSGSSGTRRQATAGTGSKGTRRQAAAGSGSGSHGWPQAGS